MNVFLLFMLASIALGQIEQPRIGVMLDQHGDARAVIGVAGSATVSEPLWTGVQALACSSTGCFAKTQTALLSSAGEVLDAPDGAAILALEGSSVYAYFPDAPRLVHWRDGQLEPLDFTSGGEVLDLRVVHGQVEYAARRADGVWVEDWYVGEANAAILVDQRILLATAEQVRLVRPDGTETDFPVAGVTSFVRMSDSYVELITPHGMWALRIEPGREELFLLPGVAQE